MQITLVGAGSFDFNGPLLRSLHPVAARRGLSVALCDLDAEAVDDMAQVVERLNEEAGARVPVSCYTELEPAVRDADFVTLTLNHGGLRADLADFQNALDHGFLPKHVDTIGPAGWLRALRMGAFMARLLPALRPDATVLDLSNPLSLIVRMATLSGRRAFGFCHGAQNRALSFGPWLGLEGVPHVRVWGTNHLAWLTELSLDGEDLYPQLLAFLRQSPDHRVWRYNLELHERFGTMPVLEAQHTADFFPGFNDPATLEAHGLHLWDGPPRLSQAEDRTRRRRAFATGETPIAKLSPSGEGIEKVLDALLGGPAARGIYNVPLPEAAAGLPAGAIAEGWVTIDAAGARQDPAPALPEWITALHARVAGQQETAAAGCLAGTPEGVLEALAAEPNVASAATARTMVARALRERPELFAEEWCAAVS